LDTFVESIIFFSFSLNSADYLPYAELFDVCLLVITSNWT